jgi:hypothetical protein
VFDDPLARQQAIEDHAAGYAGTRKCGRAANMPPGSSRVRKPTLDETGPGREASLYRPSAREPRSKAGKGGRARCHYASHGCKEQPMEVVYDEGSTSFRFKNRVFASRVRLFRTYTTTRGGAVKSSAISARTQSF